MKNVKMVVEGNTLKIEVNLAESQGPSASGKTDIIATTSGNVAVPGREEVQIGLNIYKKRSR